MLWGGEKTSSSRLRMAANTAQELRRTPLGAI